MIQHFSFNFFPLWLRYQTFFHSGYIIKPRNQALLFTKLRLLQGIHFRTIKAQLKSLCLLFSKITL